MKFFIVITAILLTGCVPYKKGEVPLMYDTETDSMRPCAHISMLGDCKHFM